MCSTSASPRISERGERGEGEFSGCTECEIVSGGPGACIYSIHTCSLDVLRLILSNFYLIRAMPFVIFGLMKGEGEVKGGGEVKGEGEVKGGGGPFSPLGEPLTAKKTCVGVQRIIHQTHKEHPALVHMLK